MGTGGWKKGKGEKENGGKRKRGKGKGECNLEKAEKVPIHI